MENKEDRPCKVCVICAVLNTMPFKDFLATLEFVIDSNLEFGKESVGGAKVFNLAKDLQVTLAAFNKAHDIKYTGNHTH